MYNSCGVRKPQSAGWKERVYQVQRSYWQGHAAITMTHQEQITTSLKNRLQYIRESTRETLKMSADIVKQLDGRHGLAEKEHFSNSVKSISVQCTDNMITLAEQVMSESMNTLVQKPPCNFQVVAIGSLARGEATPYSDLEYMFLIQMKSPDTIAYFERLAMTSYFLIGNLQETKLSYMAIKELEGWFDDKAINGFKIDGLAPGAGNIPTGNGSAETKNHFILTPEDLAAKYESVLNNPVEKEALRGDLTAMLSYMKPIFSYCGEDAEGVNSKPDLLGKSRQLMTNIVQSQSRTSINVKMLEADIKKFNFVPDTKLKERGFTIDVKKQLYRFPSILLFDLSIVFGVRAESAWQTTHQLLTEGKTSTQLSQVLEFVLACACFIRLSAYLYHNSHDDRISVADKEINPGREAASQHRRWFVPVELFISPCDDMIPLKKQLKSYNFVNIHPNYPWRQTHPHSS